MVPTPGWRCGCRNNARPVVPAAALQRSCGERRGMRLFWGSAPPRSVLGMIPRSALAPLAVLGVVLMAACSTGQPSSSSSQDPSKLTVWVDAVRLPVAEAYAKARPNVKVDIVTYDG